MLKVKQIFDDSEQRYGADKIRAVLAENGLRISTKRVLSIVLYHLELLPAVRPCHDIAMATDGGQPEGMRLVQVGINPLLVKLVGSAVFGKRVHVACRLLKALQDFCRIIDEQELVVNMVTGEH